MANLFPFYRGSREIRDGHFGDFFAHAAELGGHFGAELETVAVKANLRKHRSAEDFIAGGFVVNAGAIKKIGEVSEQLRAEKESHAAFWPVRPHAINDVRPSLFERFEQGGIVL